MNQFEYESAYLLGARIGCKKLLEWWQQAGKEKGGKVYMEAEFQLFTSSNDNMFRFLSRNGKDIAYRNHLFNKKGNLIKCEAYWKY